MAENKLVPRCPQDVTETWLKTVLEKDNQDLKVEVLSLQVITEANGYLGGVFSAIVKFNGNSDETRLFIKIGVRDDSPFGSFILLSKVDIREVQVYQEDLADLVALEKGKIGKSELEQVLPKVYVSGYDASDDTRGLYLVMEDLTVDHKMIDIADGLIKEQAIGALEAMARFHALSHCWQKKKGKPFPTDMRTVMSIYDKALMSFYYNNRDLAVEDLGSNPKTKHLIPYIQDVFKDYKSFQLKTMSLVDDTFLIHGDLWTNNLMFKSKPDVVNADGLASVKIFDWQFFSSGPPAFDFCQLVFTGISPDNLNAWWEELLDAYIDKLESTLGEFEIQSPFTKDQFVDTCHNIGIPAVFNFMVTGYELLWRSPRMIGRFILVTEKVIKHRSDLFNIK